MILNNQSGTRQRIFPGNKEFVVGDKFRRPPGGKGQGGKKASDQGEGEDAFSFTLTKDEYLELLFEGLELPDLVKKNTVETETIGRKRAGLTTTGTPANLNLVRTMRNSLGRRLALGRPTLSRIEEVEAEITALQDRAPLDGAQKRQLDELCDLLERLNRRRKIVGYIDPLDLRFDTHTPEKIRNSKAVVFCLMDVSGSMQEREKDLAKRFFILLHLFLDRRYEHTEIVFVRHTHHAQEVDEQTFFHSRETGGTIVSTALEKMDEIIRDRFPTDEWNIYGAQASDGDNFSHDLAPSQNVLRDRLLPVCQYYAYVEITEEGGSGNTDTPLWLAYKEVADTHANFEMQRVADPAGIYPVFRKIFAAKGKGAVS